MEFNSNAPFVPLTKNELSASLISINAMNPWTGHDSSARGAMFSTSHITQMLVVDQPTPRRVQTGVENEFGKYTFKHKMPCDASVVKMIPKYRQTMSADSVSKENNPSTLLIYENIETKVLGILELHTYSTAVDVRHQHFGFHYEFNENIGPLKRGTFIPKGTVLADSPNVDGFLEVQDYKYGIELNTAYMGLPDIIEDGVVVSESCLDKISSRGYERRTATWGKKYFPLNLYGDENNYKPFPDIGDTIGSDALLFAMRPYDERLAPVEMDPRSLRTPDYDFDKLVYAKPNAKVVDININHDTTNRIPPTPVGMEVQTDRYYQSLKTYYKTILEVYDGIYRERRGHIEITPEFNRLLVDAIAFVGLKETPSAQRMKLRPDIYKRRTQQLYRRHDIDDWRVEITFEYKVRPNIGHKISGCHGNC